ncbi:protein kinase domain-containing protein, partial [Haematococcus lacustris]
MATFTVAITIVPEACELNRDSPRCSRRDSNTSVAVNSRRAAPRMGCASSTPVNDELEYKDVKQEPEKTEFDTQHHIPASVEAALTGSARGPDRKGVKFAGDVLDTPSSKRNGDDDGVDSVSRAVSVSGRPSRTSISAKREKSFVGADLKSIMDEHGMLNPLVSRQLSVMSHYSVRSESGSVMITPEDAEAPFKLIRLIGRGGFGNVYLGDWDEERVAIKTSRRSKSGRLARSA